MGVLAADKIYASCRACDTELLKNLWFRAEAVTARGGMDLTSDLMASIFGPEYHWASKIDEF